jgi:putative toxin-antitoxin system antitoxin component (TIGR02293 family)
MRVKKRKDAGTKQVSDSLQNAVQEPAVAYEARWQGPFSLLRVNKPAENFANEKAMYLSVIRGGLPRQSLDALMEVSGLSVYEMANILDTTDRTLRRHDGHTLLTREHSERILEMAQLYNRGREVFGDLAVFRQWMQSPIPALGGQLPKSFLDTSMGIHMLMMELGRIEHGVFA